MTRARFGALDVVILLVMLYAFVVAVYNTFVSDCTLAGSSNFGRKLATWLIAWPLMLLCKAGGPASGPASGPLGPLGPSGPLGSPTTSFSYSTEI